ncbi:MAG: hypothetical protein ABI790_11215 [Betaproteobacteria bacterium]
MKTGFRKYLSIIILIGTAVGFAISFVMLQRVIGGSSPWLGLLAMFYFLGLTKVAEPLFLLRMPAVLRRIRSWEMKGTLNRRLLVPSFGNFLRESPLRYLNAAVYLSQAQSDVLRVYRQAEAAEAAHFWAASLFTPYIGYVWLSGQPREAMIFLVIQVFFNFYPILHLRLVRGRIDRLIRRRNVGTSQARASVESRDTAMHPTASGGC